MQERPIGPLADALVALGGTDRLRAENGLPPAPRERASSVAGSATIDGSVSSQFISSILMAAPYAKRGVEAFDLGHSRLGPYLDITPVS